MSCLGHRVTGAGAVALAVYRARSAAVAIQKGDILAQGVGAGAETAFSLFLGVSAGTQRNPLVLWCSKICLLE